MKLHLLLLLMLTTSLHAEQVEVYQVVETPIPGNRKTLEVGTRWISVGKRISALDTGERSLRSIIAGYREQSWGGEPFYGPVEQFIFKDSAGKLYLAHFEYLKGHKILGKGLRFAIIELTAVAGRNGQFLGSPYNGSSVTDETILKQLRILVSDQKESAVPSDGEKSSK